MLCCKEFFFYPLVFNVSMFSRLCLETRLITKRKEIDVKSVYLYLGSDKVAGLIKGFLVKEKELMVIFCKQSYQ